MGNIETLESTGVGANDLFQLLNDLAHLADGRKYHYRIYTAADRIQIAYSESEFAYVDGLLVLDMIEIV